MSNSFAIRVPEPPAYPHPCPLSTTTDSRLGRGHPGGARFGRSAAAQGAFPQAQLLGLQGAALVAGEQVVQPHIQHPLQQGGTDVAGVQAQQGQAHAVGADDPAVLGQRDEAFADRLVRALQAERAALELHRFPDGESLARLDAAELILRKATWLYDNGKPCGREANTAKYLCADAGFGAADRALQLHGGMGYSEEYHVSRYFRESRLMKIAPVSQEMILNFLGSHVLGLPRSY